MDGDQEPLSAHHSGINLRISVLRHLPTPVVVLSPSRTVIYLNKAVRRLLGHSDSIRSQNELSYSQDLDDLGIKLLDNTTWTTVLEELLAANIQASQWDNEAQAREVSVVISTRIRVGFNARFTALLSMINADGGSHYVLSIERPSALFDCSSSSSQPAHLDAPLHSLKRAGNYIREPILDVDAARIKQAIFDSSETLGFIISADGKFYLANKKARKVIGNALGGVHGADGDSVRAGLKIWNETFTRRLDQTEYPGIKVIRKRKPFTNYRCGFEHHITKEKIVMSVNGECLYSDDTGEFIGGVCWCYDLQNYNDYVSMEQKRMIASHETICNLMPHLVWTTTPEGLCDYYSDGWCTFTGLSKEESYGMGYTKVIHPDDLPRVLSSWQNDKANGIKGETEVRYRRYDGAYRWSLTRIVPFRDKSGRILKWYGTNTDIHNLVMRRIEAARHKAQIMTVLDHAEVNMFSIDWERKITLAEGALLWKTIGTLALKSDLLGNDILEVFSKVQEGGMPDILDGRVDVVICEDVVGENTFKTRMVAELEHNRIDGGQAPRVIGVLGLSIDITDMKARAKLELDNERLIFEEQAAKDSNQIKSRFLANMSHELRTPTSGIIGMVELLSDDPDLTRDQREFVNSIRLSAKALLTIVNDILDFSKIESNRLDIEEVPFNVSNTVGELSKLLSMFARQKGLTFEYVNKIEDSLEVLGDPGRVRQILSNLLTNALKFTSEGTVSLSVTSQVLGLEQFGEESVEITFVIQDTGIGIEKEVLDKLFTPFRQGDASTARLYGGTGLGLTISRNLATLMGGSINLTSVPRVGSTATFTVPFKVSLRRSTPMSIQIPSRSSPDPGFRLNMSPRPSGSLGPPNPHQRVSQDLLNQDILNQQISTCVTDYYAPTAFSPKSSIRGLEPTLITNNRKDYHVLVVEDNAINQVIAIKTIKKLGFSVEAAWNGKEALSYLLDPSPKKPRPDIILMDVQMPILDGYEATKILRTSKGYNEEGSGAVPLGIERQVVKIRDIPVIAMTASAIQGDKEKCYEAGMDDYLAKPVEKVKLEEMLVKWVGRQRENHSLDEQANDERREPYNINKK
ncbi:hypothetical protein B0O99DRAFT_514983 [Bisporella sp. PMI_857]|nr:hypothetical protein B0O99DRAFT_514983 [Bisporella sp. PMI_857]